MGSNFLFTIMHSLGDIFEKSRQVRKIVFFTTVKLALRYQGCKFVFMLPVQVQNIRRKHLVIYLR